MKYDPKGIKIYPATGIYPSDSKLKDHWGNIENLTLTVVIHADMALPLPDEKYRHPSEFGKVAEEYSDMNIIIAHLDRKFRG